MSRNNMRHVLDENLSKCSDLSRENLSTQLLLVREKFRNNSAYNGGSNSTLAPAVMEPKYQQDSGPFETKENMLKLIKLYRTFETLWNPQAYGYDNPKLKECLWNLIAHKMGCKVTVAQVQEKMHFLCNTYCASKKSNMKTKLAYFDELRFLDCQDTSTFQPKATSDSLYYMPKAERGKTDGLAKVPSANSDVQSVGFDSKVNEQNNFKMPLKKAIEYVTSHVRYACKPAQTNDFQNFASCKCECSSTHAKNSFENFDKHRRGAIVAMPRPKCECEIPKAEVQHSNLDAKDSLERIGLLKARAKKKLRSTAAKTSKRTKGTVSEKNGAEAFEYAKEHSDTANYKIGKRCCECDSQMVSRIVQPSNFRLALDPNESCSQRTEGCYCGCNDRNFEAAKSTQSCQACSRVVKSFVPRAANSKECTPIAQSVSNTKAIEKPCLRVIEKFPKCTENVKVTKRSDQNANEGNCFDSYNSIKVHPDESVNAIGHGGCCQCRQPSPRGYNHSLPKHNENDSNESCCYSDSNDEYDDDDYMPMQMSTCSIIDSQAEQDEKIDARSKYLAQVMTRVPDDLRNNAHSEVDDFCEMLALQLYHLSPEQFNKAKYDILQALKNDTNCA